MVKDVEVRLLTAGDISRRDQALEVLLASFPDRVRYDPERLQTELAPRPLPFYRHLFLAELHGRVVGVGALKAADWAQDTHLLYLSAVAPAARGRGIGRRLLAARVAWVKSEFVSGRVLVSSAKVRRFKDFGFKPVGKSAREGRQLLLLEF